MVDAVAPPSVVVVERGKAVLSATGSRGRPRSSGSGGEGRGAANDPAGSSASRRNEGSSRERRAIGLGCVVDRRQKEQSRTRFLKREPGKTARFGEGSGLGKRAIGGTFDERVIARSGIAGHVSASGGTLPGHTMNVQMARGGRR